MIEIFARRQLLASHARLFKRGARSTLDAHRPANHRAVIDTTIERLLARAQAIAPAVAAVLTEQFNGKRHPSRRSPARNARYFAARSGLQSRQLAAACERALKLQACSHATHRIWRDPPVIARARERARVRLLPLKTENPMLIEP